MSSRVAAFSRCKLGGGIQNRQLKGRNSGMARRAERGSFAAVRGTGWLPTGREAAARRPQWHASNHARGVM